MNVTDDAFLGGQLLIRQPENGFRAGTDALLLAAFVNAPLGGRVIELGTGVGTAALCLGHRLKGLSLTGVELQTDYADLARWNAEKNNIPLTVVNADIFDLPHALKTGDWDHVLMNPPYFSVGAHTEPQSKGKELAHIEKKGLAFWIDIALRLLADKGTLSLIYTISQLNNALAALEGRAGAVEILPISTHAGDPASRFLLRARKNRKTPLKLHFPLIMHSNQKNQAGTYTYTDKVEGVMRFGKGL